MNPIKPTDSMSREEIVSLALRQCALLLDPRYGRLSVLAEEFNLHENTLGIWIRNGRVPPKMCKRLLDKFGKRYVDFKQLVDA